jgi:2-oxo-4-hydroxy-4-carboxy--5-ureidoimidazoline (OHCU) decarboxylase
MQPDRATLEMLFENAPRFCDRLEATDFRDWDDVLTRAEELARSLPEDEQLELIDGHPRIGALSSTVSATSFQEQGYDRDPGTAELQARLDGLNRQYEALFGFRFVVFVNGRSRAAIADLMEAALSEMREEELNRALSDVFAIARHRLSSVSHTSKQ